MITFETKVWEKDWKYILQGNYLNKIIRRCKYAFAKKAIFINNVNDREEVEHYCKKKIEEKIIDNYYFAEDYAKEVLDFFQIEKDSFKGGYYYSIAELTGIYLCKTKYLLHFSGDSFMARRSSSWIEKALNKLEEDPEIVVANPTWNHKYKQAKYEAIDRSGPFYTGFGFSDQCYLIRTEDFRKPVYNEHNIWSRKYPKYGGELFEKRADSYMRNHDLLRITDKKASYIHKNFSKNKLYSENALLRYFYLQARLLK